jgi:type III secretion protein R
MTSPSLQALAAAPAASIHPVWLIAAALLLALVPLVLSVATSYLKVSIVLGMVRTGLGTPQVPNGLVIGAISVGLSLFIMGPIAEEIFLRARRIDTAVLLKAPAREQVVLAAEILAPWRQFLEQHSGARETATLVELDAKFSAQEAVTLESANGKAPQSSAVPAPLSAASIDTESKPSLRVVLVGFMLSELKQGFMLALILLLPFLVVDLVISNLLVGLGMQMVSPPMVTLPLKLLLFVAVDGWLLIGRGLVQSYALH